VADPTKITINQLAPAKIVLNPAPVVINNTGGSTTPATNSTLGVVIVGANLSITGNGVLSATGGGGSVTSNLPWANITARATTILGYGITDAYPLAGNPSGFLVASSLTPYALTSSLSAYAPLASPALTGTPTAPTATAGLSSTQLATTAFVTGGISTLSNTVAATYVTASDANNAFVAKTISVIAGTGLTGGGALSVCRTLSLAVSNATAGTYGSATVVPVVTVDIYGRITSVSNIAISGGGGVTSVTGGTGITVTGTTTPSVAIDSTVATLTGTQTLSSKTLASPTISGELFLNSVSLRQAGVLRQSGSAAMTAYEQLTGSVLDINVATDTTFTLNSGTALPAAWNITIIQTGLGKITIVGAGTYSVVGRNGLKTAGQYAVIGIFQTTATGVFIVTGDTTT
jgi:hypothetical protein